jgi:hypothetical protein
MSKAMTVAALLIASAVTSCATTPPPAPDTETQRKVRTDLEQCNADAGAKAYDVAVTPVGKYSFQVVGRSNADTILMCMANKKYSGRRVSLDSTGYEHSRRYGGEGEPSR